MAIVEIDEVCIDKDLYSRAKDGDSEAKEEIQGILCDTVLYYHNFSHNPNDVVVKLRDLEKANIIETVRVEL